MKLKALSIATLLCLTAGAQAGTMSVFLNETAPGYWQADYDSDFLTGPLLGGAANVAMNLARLGAQAHVVGIIG